MSDLILIFSSLRSRLLGSFLSIFLTAFGVMISVLVLLFTVHIHTRLQADGQKIDLVVGAKGSALQLILSSVYHVDIPTGNIDLLEAQKWMKHPQVLLSVPLALGDNWHGFRIVGTTADCLSLYNASFYQGRLWDKPFEAVAGAHTGLVDGSEFSGAHGLLGGGHSHEEHKYKVVGVLKPTGSVLDRLILTSVSSVLEIHGMESEDHHHEEGSLQIDSYHHRADEASEEREHVEDHSNHEQHPRSQEITALLLKVKTPIALMNLPQLINRQSVLQAANPAFEMVRLTSMLGFGERTFTFISLILVAVSALSIFAGLAGSLETRKGDLALLRALGFSRLRLIFIITAEAMIITSFGIILGILLGCFCFDMLVYIIPPLKEGGASSLILPIDYTLIIVFSVFISGFISGMIPALRASRVDAALQLSKGM